MSNGNAYTGLIPYPFALCSNPADPNATTPKAPAPEQERYDIVRVVYLDAACGGEEREVLYNHSDALPRGVEATTCVRDVREVGPLRFSEACGMAERLVKPYE